MIYLSRLQLDPRNRQVWQRVLRNAYAIHQLVMRGFPDGTKRETAQVLHRLEAQEDIITLLVQSQIEPDWGQIDQAYLRPTNPYDFLSNPAVKSVNLAFQEGQAFHFRLCANPTIKKGRWNEETGKARNSNRVPLYDETDQIAWLNKRAKASGFQVQYATISQAQSQKMWKQSGQRPITLYSVQFDGFLLVKKPEQMLTAIQAGIGPAKAFGCGLLSVA